MLPFGYAFSVVLCVCGIQNWAVSLLKASVVRPIYEYLGRFSRPFLWTLDNVRASSTYSNLLNSQCLLLVGIVCEQPMLLMKLLLWAYFRWFALDSITLRISEGEHSCSLEH